MTETTAPPSGQIQRDVRCLFVDDEPALLRGLSRVVKLRRPHWEIHCANSGHAALELLISRRFDILVTDLQMPTMNGVTLLKIVKARHPGTVRLVHSSHIGTVGRSQVEALAHRMLSKPAGPDEFIALLDWGVDLSRQLERNGTE